jgi:hypothetical protein
MSTALQVKVVTLLGYVALSTALVLMLAEDVVPGAATALFYAWLR